MTDPILNTRRFRVAVGQSIQLTYNRSDGKPLTMMIDADEAKQLGEALIDAAQEKKP